MQGIKNEGNMCFLNTILNCLTKMKDSIPIQNQFHEYLRSTLDYIKNETQIKNIYLFILELRNRNPGLFTPSFENQEAQDAYEILNWLLNESQLDQEYLNINSFEFPNFCNIKQNMNRILIYQNWSDAYTYYVHDELNFKEELQLIFCENEHQQQIQIYQINKISGQIDPYLLDNQQYEFDLYEYYAELIENQYEIALPVQLQYIENDKIINIEYLRFLYLQQEFILINDLKKIIQKQIPYHIDFDIVVDSIVMELDQLLELRELDGIDCLFRTKNLEQFQFCQQFGEVKGTYNYDDIDRNQLILENQEIRENVTIQLQRFQYCNNKIIKNCNPYKLQEQIYITHQEITIQYELVGISCHIGKGLHGHYVSYVKNGNQWEYRDDENVQFVDKLDYICMKNAYILFYRKKEMNIK